MSWKISLFKLVWVFCYFQPKTSHIIYNRHLLIILYLRTKYTTFMEINDIRVQHTAIQVAHLFSPTQWSKGKPVSTLSSRTNTHPPGIQIGRFQKGKEELEQSYLETKTNSFKGSCLIFFLSFFLSPLPSPSLSPFLSFYLFIYFCHTFSTWKFPG